MKGGIIIVLLILIIVGTVCTFGISYETTTSGTHTGIVTAIEHTGFFFKTYTVYVKTDAMSSQEDAYCLTDTSLIPILTKLEEGKEKVTITFKDYIIKGWLDCNGEPNGIITGVNQ